MGKYDAVALVDAVRSYTGVEKVTWIGHSYGTTQMFMALVQDPDLWS
tara:strand:- start:838 stop:978 length:141 start_codon:yes stop_codon:yes gene_type:complete